MYIGRKKYCVYQRFLLFLQYFEKSNLSGWLKVRVVVKRLKKNKDSIFVILRIDGVLNDTSNTLGNNLKVAI